MKASQSSRGSIAFGSRACLASVDGCCVGLRGRGEVRGLGARRRRLSLKYLRLKVFTKAYSCLIKLLLCFWISVTLPHREFKHNINMYLNELRRKLVVPSPVLIRYVFYKKHINADFAVSLARLHYSVNPL